MPAKKKSAEAATAVDWTVENELRLLHAAIKFKPAGLIKHFNMALILNELAGHGLREVPTAAVWDHLATLYNLEKADRLEKAASAVVDESEEFKLPKKEFQAVMNEMKKSDASGDKDDNKKPSSVPETPKSTSKRPTRSTPGTGSSKRRK